MEKITLATEMLHSMKLHNHRLFMAFLIMLVLWLATISVFLWYFSSSNADSSSKREVDEEEDIIIDIGD